MDSTTDADHGPQPLPANIKLRWRPYSNGNTLKKKPENPKASAHHSVNAKALAHKVRKTSSTSRRPPVEVKLQWEEAETIQSMSHGGHPHNQHHPHLFEDHASPTASSSSSSSFSQRRSQTRTASPEASSTTSSVSGQTPSPTSTTSSSSFFFTSPTTAFNGSGALSPSKLVLLSGDSDLNHYQASLPGLTSMGDPAMSLNALFSAISNPAHHIAMESLLIANNNNNNNSSSNSNSNSTAINNTNLRHSGPTLTMHNASPNMGPMMNSSSSSSSNSNAGFVGSRKMSNTDFMSLMNLDDLLVSCGYSSDSNSASSASPEMLMSDYSLTPSPVSDFMDLRGNTNGGALSGTSNGGGGSLFSPLVLNKSESSTSPELSLLPSPATSSKTAPGPDPFGAFINELTSPFSQIQAKGETGLLLPTTGWPTLFPGSEQSSQAPPLQRKPPQPVAERSEMATQTDDFDNSPPPPLSPMSTLSTTQQQLHDSPMSSLSMPLDEQELDPDWLNFLDEASLELSNELNVAAAVAANTAAASERTIWNWVEDLMKPDTVPTPGATTATTTTTTAVPSPTTATDTPMTTATSPPVVNDNFKNIDPNDFMNHNNTTIPSTTTTSSSSSSSSSIPSGYGFPGATGSLPRVGGINNGLIRTLHGTSQSRPFGTKASLSSSSPASTTATGAATSTESKDKSASAASSQESSSSSSATKSPKQEVALKKQPPEPEPCKEEQEEDVGGLMKLFRGLWPKSDR